MVIVIMRDEDIRRIIRLLANLEGIDLDHAEPVFDLHAVLLVYGDVFGHHEPPC